MSHVRSHLGTARNRMRRYGGVHRRAVRVLVAKMSAATVFEDAQSGDEGSLDAAFEAVDITSRFYSTVIAEAVSERWLWGASWKQVAGMLGCSRQFAFDRCIACFGWMDRNIVFEDGRARYVGVGKISDGKIVL